MYMAHEEIRIPKEMLQHRNPSREILIKCLSFQHSLLAAESINALNAHVCQVHFELHKFCIAYSK